jgi:glucokinase
VKTFLRQVNAFCEAAKGYHIKTGVFAVAGLITRTKDGVQVRQNNADFVLDEATLLKQTPLKDVTILNDFEAIGYATNCLAPGDMLVLQEGEPEKDGPRAVIGPGTGLGSSYLLPDADGAYHPYRSEGGHADLPLISPDEDRLAEFLRERRGLFKEWPIPYEEALSGRGLVALYEHLRKSRFPESPLRKSAAEVSDGFMEDQCCQAAFQLFTTLLARKSRNFALDTMATGGIYLAGGIVAKNSHRLLHFPDEFHSHPDPTYRFLLLRIPIRLITTEDAGLLGAAFAASGR